MAALRVHVLIGAALVTVAGCAGQPTQVGVNPPAAAATGAPARPKALIVPGLTTHLLAQARDDGYKPRMVDGQFRFCRVEIPVGSNLPVRQCVNTTQLRFELLQEQATRRNLEEQAPITCQAGSAC